ncbi:MAG: sigma-70 family RNA polymerase sigma factor, partial [Deltaproteobacteria bacterium]|nr:sigma-70 family RNA polymerase sigma factor [Deltaproteobacteria bacterium]
MGRRLSAPPLSAFERIYREHYRRVRWVVRARGVPESALDDVVHDAFLSIHRRLPQRDGNVPMATWVMGVARSVAFSHRRAAARRHERRAEIPEPAGLPGPQEQLEREQAWQMLSDFLETLPVEQREVFVLTQMVGLSMAEIAKNTDTTPNTLYSRLRLARRRFGLRFPQADDPKAVARLMRDAGQQERPSNEQRRRSWALLAAHVGQGAAWGVPAATLVGWKGLGLGAAAVMGLAVAWQVGGSRPDGGPAPTRQAVGEVEVDRDGSGPVRASSDPRSVPPSPLDPNSPGVSRGDGAAAHRPSGAPDPAPPSGPTNPGVSAVDGPTAASASAAPASPAAAVPAPSRPHAAAHPPSAPVRDASPAHEADPLDAEVAILRRAQALLR